LDDWYDGWRDKLPVRVRVDAIEKDGQYAKLVPTNGQYIRKGANMFFHVSSLQEIK